MRFYKVLFFCFLISLANVSFAQRTPHFETYSVGGSFTVRDSQTVTLNLNNTRFIKSIIVQAEGAYRDSMIEVMVNGEVKGTIFAPGRDPSYVVTIGETASSIQFRHRSGDSMRIHNVTATMATWMGRNRFPTGPHFPPSYDSVTGLAQRTLNAIEEIRPYSTLEEEQTYLLPMKKKAGQILVMSQARGNQAHKTSEALMALMNQIEFSAEYINQMMEQDGLFDSGVELLAIKETIDDLLN